jgi:hypothetical protein
MLFAQSLRAITVDRCPCSTCLCFTHKHSSLQTKPSLSISDMQTCQHRTCSGMVGVLVWWVWNSLQVLEVQDFMRGLQCALQQLHSAIMDLPVQPRERWA